MPDSTKPDCSGRALTACSISRRRSRAGGNRNGSVCKGPTYLRQRKGSGDGIRYAERNAGLAADSRARGLFDLGRQQQPVLAGATDDVAPELDTVDAAADGHAVATGREPLRLTAPELGGIERHFDRTLLVAGLHDTAE
jgi:hypothetical protein